jgi:hypothetical protein
VTGTAMTAAERMRLYRVRLRERGVRAVSALRPDAHLAAIRFGRGSLLTPGEKDVLRRFCLGMRRLPEMPSKLAIFGSRAKGLSGERSDLDLAVFVDFPRSSNLENAIARLAFSAQAPYREGGYGIFLNPVILFGDDPPGLPELVRKDLETIWKRSS